MEKINVGIFGYGNLGQSLEKEILNDKNFNLIAIFSRRKNITSKYKTKTYYYEDLEKFENKIDIFFLCCGSYLDTEDFAKKFAKKFCTVDAFDTHKKLSNYLVSLDKIAKENKKVCLTACGWDPGIMSIERVLFDAIYPSTPAESFWGKGISQGHSDALRLVQNVENAVQFTIPNKKIIRITKNQQKNFSNQEKHKRICYICAKKIYRKQIINDIQNMENYFAGYKTKIYFVSNKKIINLQKKLYHRGQINKFFVENKNKFYLNFFLKVDSNPIFTAKILKMCAISAKRLLDEQKFGAYSMLDVPVKYFTLDESLYQTKL